MFPDHEVSTPKCQVPRMVEAECWRPITKNEGFPGKGLLYWLALKKKANSHAHRYTESVKGTYNELGSKLYIKAQTSVS